MRRFLRDLSALFRTGDTRALEAVVGLIALVFGCQLGAYMLDALPRSPLVSRLPEPMGWVLMTVFILGGLAKLVGAIQDRVTVRLFAAISLSGVWLYLSLLTYQLGALFSVLLFLIFALQSAWIYIRLSLLRKQDLVT
jgi:ABC-type antimicrobial peptide transport system permease subunit